MKIDKEKLAALAALPDDQLWATILEIGKSYGFNLPKQAPPHSELEKIRGAVTGGAKPNLSEAIKLVNNYRKGQKNG